MFNLQPEFIEFHDKIKLSYSNNSELREKRDILLRKLSENIGDDAPQFEHFVQGSYAMHTGIKPDNDDYDIDVGLKFDLLHSDYSDPVIVKKWVYDALQNHTKKVEIRRSCVTVTYQKDGEKAFHVDFACYANEDPLLYLAKGKESSNSEHRYWELSSPKELLDFMQNRFADKDDRAQFRRAIRYLKKWKNKNFDLSGNNAPTGIALTALAYDLFVPNYQINPITQERTYDDYHALKNLVNKVKNQFSFQYDNESSEWYHSISQALFVAPYNNLFEKMTIRQQEIFYVKLCAMISKLEEVETKTKKAEACSLLVEIFGDEFPIRTERSYVGHSESA